MRLYLHSSRFSTEVSDIHLHQGCIPTIGNCTAIDSDDSEQLEPAIWFKVLVLDSVSIDCDKRAISWCTINQINCDSVEIVRSPITLGATNDIERSGNKRRQKQQRVSESMYIGGECYGYHNDLDEVFDKTVAILQSYASGGISRSVFHHTVIKLLHCYVLPAIRLTTDDVGKVEEGLRLQHQAVEAIDMQLVAQNDLEERVKQALKKQRDKFVSEILTAQQRPKYPLPFLEVLASDIDKDIKLLWCSVESLQTDIQRAKESSEETAPSGESLVDLRDKRDGVFKEYETMLHARETLREIKSASKKGRTSRQVSNPEPSQQMPICDFYLGMKKEVEHMYKVSESITNKKILTISVREALSSTAKELLRGEDSFGMDTDRTGLKKATDVLHLPKPLSWQTLTEQVSSIITIANNPVAETHTKVCESVKSVCKEAVHEWDIFHSAVRASARPRSIAIDTQTGSLSAENRLYHLANNSNSVSPSITSSDSQRSSQTSYVSDSGSKKLLRDSRSKNKADRRSKFYRSFQSEEDFPNDGDTSDLYSDDRLNFENARLRFDEHPTVQPRNTSDCFPHLAKLFSPESTHSLPYLQTEDSEINGSLLTEPSGKNGSSLVEIDMNGSVGGDMVAVYDTEKDYVRPYIEEVKKIISEHFSSLIPQIQKLLQLEDTSYFRKIWLCYESHFYQAVMEEVMALYDMEYRDVIKSITEGFTMFSLCDLDLEESPLVYMVQGVKSVDKKTTVPCQGSMSLPCSTDNQIATKSELHSLLGPITEESDVETSSSKQNKTGKTNEEKSERGIGRILRYFSDSTCKKPGRVAPDELAPRTISVYHPLSVTLIYDRRTWPLKLVDDEFGKSFDSAEDAMLLDEEIFDEPNNDSPVSTMEENSSPNDQYSSRKQLQFRAKYKKRFNEALQCINSLITETCPLQKLQHLTKCLRELSDVISSEQKINKGSEPPGADCLLDMLLILLCNVDSETAGKLYAHIMLLNDIMPPFFAAGPFSFSLVQFYVAMQFIQSRLVVLHNLAGKEESMA